LTLWHKLIGRQGETAAARFLRRRGYRILEQNFRCQAGEIDIVAEDGGVLVFVEVKARTQEEFGLPQAAVTEGKQRRMVLAAQSFLQQRGIKGVDCRFDVVAVQLAPDGSRRLELIKDAFQA